MELVTKKFFCLILQQLKIERPLQVKKRQKSGLEMESPLKGLQVLRNIIHKTNLIYFLTYKLSKKNKTIMKLNNLRSTHLRYKSSS